MQKDIAKLRELESQKERERIASLKPDETKARQEKKKEEVIIPPPPAASQPKREEVPVQAPAPEVPQTLIPKPPKRPAPIQKIMVRAAIVAGLVLVIGFFYWLLAVKKGGGAEEEVTPPAGTEEETGGTAGEEELIIPPSLITVNATETIEVASSPEISQAFSQSLEKTFDAEGPVRVVLENTTENKVLGLKDFFEAFEIASPEGLLEKFNDDFTLLIFPGQKNNLGFVTKVTETENLLNSLVSWETTMEKDTEKLFAILGKEGQALSSGFKTSVYQGVGFRYLTISREDFGICYAWFDDYFVLTSSFDSMKKTIDAVKVKELETQAGQMFIVGFEGKSVTPEFKEFFKKYLPGGILLLSKNIESKEQLKKLTADLQDLSLKEAKLPLFIAVDQEGGIISRISFAEEKTPQSEINDSSQAYQIGLERGKELKDLGINLNLAPVLDMTQEGDFLFDRSFQRDTAESGELAKYLVEGQKTASILTALKHFPGYGDIDFNPESSLAKVYSLPEVSQFKKAMEANPEFVLTANVVYENLDSSLPFSFSPAAIKFLKNNLGNDVAIVTDDLAQNYLLENFSLKDIIKKPIEAGADILIFSGWEIDVSQGLDAFFSSFENNEISQAKIKEAITKIIKIKENL